MRLRIRVLACLVVAAGCHIGQSVDGFAPAHTAAGLEMELQTDDPGSLKQFRGELLAAHDNELLLATRDGVVVVPLGAIKRAWATSNRNLVLTRNGNPHGVLATIRTVSRYPQGVTPRLLQDLLAAYHQTEPLRPQ